MSGHADTIPYLRAMLEADERHSFLAALDALLAENQRLRDALERIRKNAHGNTPAGRAGALIVIEKWAREAFAGDAE